METLTYILSFNGNGIAVLLAQTTDELLSKLAVATREELSVHDDDVDDFKTEIIGELGDWGELTDVNVTYTEESRKVKETGFTLTKTVCY
jgi:hypothetical protein